MTGAGAAQITPNYTINAVESKLIIDYITYPNEVMAQWAQANQNLSFQYYDYELSKMTYTKALADNQMIRNLGGAGKVVNKVIMGVQRDVEGAQNLVTTLNGGFEARHPNNNPLTSQDKVKTNLRYNTEFLYPINVENDAYHFNNVLQAEGQPPMVSRGMYNAQGSGMSGRKFEGQVQSTSLNGDYFWQCFKLNKNNRINQKGIELYQTMLEMENQQYTYRMWLEVVKIAQLVDGKLETSYA